MRLLITAPRLAPDYNPEAICTSNLISVLADGVARIDVVTSTPGAGVSDCPNVDVHIVPDYERESLLEKSVRHFNRYPEDGFGWARRASRVVTELAPQADVIYSRGMPFASHLAVYFARRPEDIPWVAHFSDPWPQWPEDEFWQDRMGRRKAWHSRVVNAVDGVTFATVQVGEICRSQQWGSADPVPFEEVSHVGVGDVQPSPEPGNQPVRIVHTGTFYGARKPDNLIRGWAAFITSEGVEREQHRLIHVGPVSDRITELAEELGVSDTVEQTGPVSPENAKQMQRQADVLLLVENQESRKGIYMPSKFIDYLWANRPIIALTPPEGVVAQTLPDDYPLLARPWEAKDVESAFTNMVSLETSGLPGALDSCREEFTPEVIRERLIAFLSSVAGKSEAVVGESR